MRHERGGKSIPLDDDVNDTRVLRPLGAAFHVADERELARAGAVKRPSLPTAWYFACSPETATIRQPIGPPVMAGCSTNPSGVHAITPPIIHLPAART